jgi:hypothetical protein
MTKTACAAALAALVLPTAANAVDKPPAGTPANTTATQRHDCLGPFRSDLAQTIGFNGQFNPGIHFGTVGEIQFLEDNGLANAC